MKKIFSVVALIVIAGAVSSQTIAAEENLKKQSKDSLDGWKTGGVTSLNLTQVSLTNWLMGLYNREMPMLEKRMTKSISLLNTVRKLLKTGTMLD
jgi:hypothetical protein